MRTCVPMESFLKVSPTHVQSMQGIDRTFSAECIGDVVPDCFRMKHKLRCLILTLPFGILII